MTSHAPSGMVLSFDGGKMLEREGGYGRGGSVRPG